MVIFFKRGRKTTAGRKLIQDINHIEKNKTLKKRMVEELLSLINNYRLINDFTIQNFGPTHKFLYIYKPYAHAVHKHTILYAEDDLDDLFMIRQAFEQFDGSTQSSYMLMMV